MKSKVRGTSRIFALTLACAAALALPASVVAAEAPVKEIVSSHIGWEVNTLTGGNVCGASEACRFGAQSSEPGGFLFPEGIAVSNASASPEHGDVYVADTANQRVQMLTSTGAFVSMFGWDVNKTKVEEGAPQTQRNICTAASGDVCQAGASGEAPGQLASPTSLVVDPATGNVYVEDFFNWRIQEFTATGEFVLMFGKEVNLTNHSNLCTAAPGDECKAGERAADDSTEPGAFDFQQNRGELLVIGGPENLVYVGDRHRVQRFKTDGTPAGELSLSSIAAGPNDGVVGIAVDAAGDVYVVYEVNFAKNIIYELDPSGAVIRHFELLPKRPEANAVEVQARAIALDPAGRLAVAEEERGFIEGRDFEALRGALYEVGATSLHLLTEFSNEFPTEFDIRGALSLVFTNENNMYAVGGYEVISYVHVPVAALSTGPAACKTGADNETDATLECELKGAVNPWGVPETEVWFQWGKTPTLGQRTGPQPIKSGEAPVAVNSMLTGLRPNETYYYRLAGEDEHVKAPESLASEETSFATQALPPRIVSAPSVVHAGPSSTVVFDELNPENASTTYRFQYWPCEPPEDCSACEEPAGCPQLLETEPVQSSVYGAIGTTVEARGLLPNTLYHYRLLAKSAGGEVAGETGSFTTAPEPHITAQTGTVSMITTTSALVSGTVNPDGQAATYTFELGQYSGPNTQFGIVSSGTAGAGSTPTPQTLALTGLQPGTTYAYRISARFGTGTTTGSSATGATLTFTTQGLPEAFTPTAPAQLPTLPVHFPQPPKHPTNVQLLAKALKACKHKPKRQRARCRKRAHKKYPISNKKKR
jgi:hypothetical protein